MERRYQRQLRRFFIPFAVLPLSVVLLPFARPAEAAPVRYQLDPSVSSVHFDAKSTLHPFGGDTRVLSGEMTWDAASGQIADDAVIRIPVLPIATGEPKRDLEMQKMFAAAEFPEIVFRAQQVMAVPSSPTASRYRLEGVLKIRSVERPVVLEVTVQEISPASIEVSGETTLRTDWFGLKPPSVLAVVRVLPEVKVRFKSVWKTA